MSEIIELARQAGMAYEDKLEVYVANIDDLQDFAKLVAEKERKECADMIEDLENIDWNIWDCAKAIREREKE